MLDKIKSFFVVLLQRVWITYSLFNRNKLINHAAAGAFGFLFSAAPALIIISFFVNRALAAYPDVAADLFHNISLVSGLINVDDLIHNFINSSASGLAGLVSVLAILWTSGSCAHSIQRGLQIIFPSTRFNPLRNAAVSFGLASFIIFFIFMSLLSSKFAFDFYTFTGISLIRSLYSPAMALPVRIFYILCLPLMTFAAYRFVPASRPKLKYVIAGVAVCMLLYQGFTRGFYFIIGPNRYNLLYGTLGRLFLFLIHVNFFFTFFFFGAQMIMVLGNFNVLLFIRYRNIHFRNSTRTLQHNSNAPSQHGSPHENHSRKKKPPGKAPWIEFFLKLGDFLFKSVPAPLKKYLHTYKKGEPVFSRGSRGQDAYYIVSGKAGVYLDAEYTNKLISIHTAHFFGEMEVVTSESRTASIKAETDLSVMCLPPVLFRSILKLDPETDQIIIKALSERLKSIDKHLQP